MIARTSFCENCQRMLRAGEGYTRRVKGKKRTFCNKGCEIEFRSWYHEND